MKPPPLPYEALTDSVVPIRPRNKRVETYRLMVALACEVLKQERIPNHTENVAMRNVLSMLDDYTGGDAA